MTTLLVRALNGWARPLMVALVMVLVAVIGPSGQMLNTLMYSKGQSISPAFEGWVKNPDGTFDFIFGYMNRNWEEELDVPVGPDNRIEPDGPNRGQPTHFLPRRNHFRFRVRVPGDWGTKDLVWTLTANGRTEKRYASLLPERALDDEEMARNLGAGGFLPSNKRPTVALEGDARRTARVAEPLVLTASVHDDGLPKARPAPGPSRNGQNLPPGRFASVGLRVAWMHYRGPGQVTFDPQQFKVYQDPRGDSPWSEGWTPPPLPPDGKVVVRATFGAPGTYVLQVLAHDGNLWSTQDVTVAVVP